MNAVFAGLLACSILLIQLLIGGTRLVFSLKAYAILTLASILSLIFIQRKPARANLPCLGISAIFFGYILHRAATSQWDYLWWQDFYQVIACLMVYGLTTMVITSTKARTWIVVSLLALAVVEVGFGLRQFAYADEWMPFGFIRAANTFRASGSMISPIHFAGYLEAVGVFAFALAFWGKWKAWVRFLFGYIGVLCYAGVAISGSRGGYLSAAFSLAVFALLNFWVVKRARPEKFTKVVAITVFGGLALMAIAGGLMWQNAGLRKRVDTMLNQDLRILDYAAASNAGATSGKPTVDIRIYNWQAALDQFHLAPTWGTGAGTHVYYGRLYRRPPLQADPIHAHSDYLELIAEYGIVGAVGMGLFLVFHIVHGTRRLGASVKKEFRDLSPYEPAQSNDIALTLGALGAVAAYLAHSVVDFNLHIPGNAMCFAFFFGILASPRASGKENPLALEIPFRLAIPALGVWMALSGLTKYPAEHWCEEARVALRNGKFAESIQYAERAIAMEKRNPDVYFHLGNARRQLAARTFDQVEQKRLLESALTAYDASLAIFPWDVHVLIRKAQTLDALGRFAEARKQYDAAIEHDPNLSVLRAYFAQHLFRVGREEEAREQLKKAANVGKIVDPQFLDAPIEPVAPEAR